MYKNWVLYKKVLCNSRVRAWPRYYIYGREKCLQYIIIYCHCLLFAYRRLFSVTVTACYLVPSPPVLSVTVTACSLSTIYMAAKRSCPEDISLMNDYSLQHKARGEGCMWTGDVVSHYIDGVTVEWRSPHVQGAYPASSSVSTFHKPAASECGLRQRNLVCIWNSLLMIWWRDESWYISLLFTAVYLRVSLSWISDVCVSISKGYSVRLLWMVMVWHEFADNHSFLPSTLHCPTNTTVSRSLEKKKKSVEQYTRNGDTNKMPPSLHTKEAGKATT